MLIGLFEENCRNFWRKQKNFDYFKELGVYKENSPLSRLYFHYRTAQSLK